MPQDSYTISHIAEELKGELLGGRISRIIQPSRDTLIFIIYTVKGNLKLTACLSAEGTRLSLGEDGFETPAAAPNFCMLLRKHLQNAEILDIFQPDFERIICFDFMCVSDFSASQMRLCFELMGKYSNAVLIKDGIITGALKTSSLGDKAKRMMLCGVKYVPPEPQGKADPRKLNELKDALGSAAGGDRVKETADRVKGISYRTALDMAETYGGELTAERIYEYVNELPAAPCVLLRDGKPFDFAVRSADKNAVPYPSVLQAQTAFYAYSNAKKQFERTSFRLLSATGAAIKKAEKRLAAVLTKLDECADAENERLKGELITANIYAVERGMTVLKAQNYYDSDGGEITIELDGRLTPSQNAQKYYKRYQKLKRTRANADIQLKETEERLAYLKSIETNIKLAESPDDLAETEDELRAAGLLKEDAHAKKKERSLPYRTYEYGGFTIAAGRNNVQNERLMRELSPDDIWLHTQKYHSSHVAIITEGRKVPDDVLTAAAEICAYYSEGRQGNKIPVDYTQRRHVKKPPKSNAGFAIYTDYSTILADPDGHEELTAKR